MNGHVNQADVYICSPDWSWEATVGQLPDYDLWTVMKGTGTLDIEGKIYHFTGGDCFLLRPHIPFRAHQERSHPLTVLFVHFDYSDKCALPFYTKLDDLTFFKKCHERVLASRGDDEAAHWLECLLSEVRRCADSQVYSGHEKHQHALVEAICQELREHPDAKLNWEMRADQHGYSPDHLTRLFRKFTATSPMAYLSGLRMERAKTLLLSSDLSIGRITELLGYSDICYFSRKFKEKTGLSPGGYRKKS